MFYGAISDFFAQAVISFFLGHRNLGVFSEFLESLESSDVSNLAQMSRVRAAASESASLWSLGVLLTVQSRLLPRVSSTRMKGVAPDGSCWRLMNEASR
jgi:hypothetical protein